METQRRSWKGNPIGGHSKRRYFCSISHMTHSLYDSTDNYDSTHPNLEHDSHSTHTLSVILYPHLSYSSHDESHHTSFSHMFRHFLSSLQYSFMAALHPHQCCVSSLLMLRFMTHIAHNDAITTLSLHHSFSHYETAFLYIRASLAHVLDSQFKLYSLALLQLQSSTVETQPL